MPGIEPLGRRLRRRKRREEKKEALQVNWNGTIIKSHHFTEHDITKQVFL
jgi:hypothetical protein